ncbi:hypothetical protein MHO82_22535 [Vibrio sp. Of7-15]|uniref:hypothetical protein n=1 Tax=Vibrio sp. Of7-15 TaxID=2724879 RepID=UPI001EF37EDE|nr:hypothetical protein [Vibrio sp. Of7-15]MCG7499646.1 hypothetical protein [Vibrio sp. Of7-15]
MKLVWIHGGPAAGKLTVATCLNEQFGYKLFHNHLAVDLSLSIYDEFGDKDFLSFTNRIRRLVLSKAREIGVSHLVLTSMTCNDSDSEEVEKYLSFFIREGIDVYPIHLNPRLSVLLERCVSESRQSTNKLSNAESVSDLAKRTKFLKIEHENTLSIDNSNLTPLEVSKIIMSHVDNGGNKIIKKNIV